MFKRIRPRARGMAFMIKKRMSHIRVTVDSARVSQAGRSAVVCTDARFAERR